MTPLRVPSRIRFLPLLVAAVFVTLSLALDTSSAHAASRGRACAYVPLAIWVGPGEGIVERLGTDQGTIYVYDPDRSRGPGRAIVRQRPYWATDAKVSPSGDLIAFQGTLDRFTSSDLYQGVGILDMAGNL